MDIGLKIGFAAAPTHKRQLMKIQDGLIYSIVDLPPNISLDAVDGIVNDFKETFFIQPSECKSPHSDESPYPTA